MVAAVALCAPAALARPGDVDHGYAGGGAALDLGADSTEAGAIALDPFGRAVVGGSEASGRLVVMRLTAGGRRDRRFGRGGVTTVTLPGLAPAGVRGLAVFRDGRIVLAATLEAPDGASASRIAVARLLPDGDLDPNFGDGGIAVVGPPGAGASALSMTRDGVIVVGGGVAVAGGDAPLVLRLAFDGTPDAAFDRDGVWTGEAAGLRGWARGVLAYSDGSAAFALGAAPGALGPGVLVAGRLTAAGALDPGFGGGDGIADAATQTPLARDGRAPGIADAATQTPLARDGRAPGIAGAATQTPLTRDGGTVGIVAGPGGRLLVAGTVVGRRNRAEGAVARLLADGAPDPRFSGDGVVRLSARGGLRLAALARTRDGRMVVGGRAGRPDAAVVRLRAGGARDRGFGRRGAVVRPLGRPPLGRRTYSAVAALAIQRGGGVLAAGAVADDNRLPGQRTGRRFLAVTRLRG